MTATETIAELLCDSYFVNLSVNVRSPIQLMCKNTCFYPSYEHCPILATKKHTFTQGEWKMKQLHLIWITYYWWGWIIWSLLLTLYTDRHKATLMAKVCSLRSVTCKLIYWPLHHCLNLCLLNYDIEFPSISQNNRGTFNVPLSE